MRWRACLMAALFLAVAIPMTPAPPAQAAHAMWWDAALRVWDVNNVFPESQALLLAPEEGHDEYSFAVESKDPGLGGTTAVIQVRHAATGDVVCEGAMAEYEDTRVYRKCDDLRVGHGYIVTYTVSLPAEIVLYAKNNPF